MSVSRRAPFRSTPLPPRHRGRFVVDSSRTVTTRSQERRASNCQLLAQSRSQYELLIDVLILPGDKEHFIPVTFMHGPFEDIYQSLILQKFALPPRVRLLKLKHAITKETEGFKASTVQRIICVDPTTKCESREYCVRYRRFPKSTLEDSELLPVRRLLETFHEEQVLNHQSSVEAFQAVVEVLCRWRRIGMRGRNMLYGYEGFPLRNGNELHRRAARGVQPSLETCLDSADDSTRTVPTTDANGVSGQVSNPGTRDIMTRVAAAGDSAGADDLAPHSEQIRPTGESTDQSSETVRISSQRLLSSARNDYIFRNLKKVLDARNATVFGVVAKSWLDQHKSLTSQNPEEASRRISIIEEKIYLFAVERASPRPRQSVLQKLQSDLESLAILYISIRRSFNLPLYEDIGWPQCRERQSSDRGGER